MGTKISISDLSAIDATALAPLNQALDDLADEFDKVVYRDGTSPSQLTADLDANSNKIVNLGAPVNNSDAVRLQDVTDDAATAKATAVTIDDTAGDFTSDNVEGALGELGDLTGLTTAEIDQLKNINSVTISNTQWSTLGSLTASAAEVNKLDGVTATTAELNNADESATSGGGFMKGPTTSSDPGLAFDTWRTPNANRPTNIKLSLVAESNDIALGQISVDVDESGGTTPDYTHVVLADSMAGTGETFTVHEFLALTIPAGGSYRIRNTTDPQSGNAITFNREFTL